MPGGRFSSLVRIASALAVVFALGACTPGGQFDPTEVVSTDLFNAKKKIAGDREPLFPQGVPGAETGVPPDLVKGYQPPPEPVAPADAEAAKAAAAKTAAVAEKPKPKPRPKPKIARAPAAAPQQAQDPIWNQKAPSAVPAPTGQSSQSPWPAPPSTQTAPTNWPDPRTVGQSSQAAPAAPAQQTQ